MTSYTQIFGGSTIYPSEVSYLALALDANTQMSWPIEADAGANIVAKIMDVTPSAGSLSVIMPPASQTSNGQTVLFNNTGLHTFTVRDFTNGQIAVVAPGEQWQVYITDNTTDAGSWVALNYGATTATVQPSALAGFGLTPIGTSIATATPVVTFNTTPFTVTAAQRATLLVWDDTGIGAVTLPIAADVGSNYFVSLRNSGGGNLVISPAGGEQINGLSSLTLAPGDSATIATDGLNWYTLGFGQSATFAFDYTTINVTGGTYTLSGVELNRIAYRFAGILTSNSQIVVPATTQQYWVTNATTGAFTLGVKTASQVTPIDIPQGASAILYCDGSDVILASAASNASLTVVTVPYGGTGITSYTTGDMIYASGSTTLTKLAAVAANNVLKSNGVGAAPSWGKVVLTTDVTGAGVNASGLNATVPVVYVQAVNAATNVDFAVEPKGSGAVLASIPDGTATGGNKRGARAVDFSRARSSASQVASGANSVIVGGEDNTASASYTSIGGGYGHIVSATYSHVGGGSSNTISAQRGVIAGGEANEISANFGAVGGGYFNVVSGAYSAITGGSDNAVSNTYAVIGGGSNNIVSGTRGVVAGGNANQVATPYASILGGASNLASAQYATIGGGRSNVASGEYSTVTGGSFASTRGIYGVEAYASGRFSTNGDAQRESYILRGYTVGITTLQLTTDGTSPFNNNQVVLPNTSCFTYEVILSCRRPATNEVAGFKIEGVAIRNANAASTALVGTPTYTTLGSNFSSAFVLGTDIYMQADTTNGALAVVVKGQTGATINWVAQVRTVEVVG